MLTVEAFRPLITEVVNASRPEPSRIYMTIAETAKYTRRSVGTIHNRIADGTLTPRGRKPVTLLRSEVDTAMDKRLI